MGDRAGGEGPLAGIRVLEVATFVFGPAAATVMSDFGARVIKVEPPRTGDPYRYLPQVAPLPACEHNYCWLLDARNKESIALDLKQDEGRAVVLELARRSDVFLTNYHPSVLEALRLRYEDLAPENERLIYAHATGYGEEGPEVERPGYDATAWWARSGLMDAVRPAGQEPGLATPAMGDHPSAMSVFGGILLALYARLRTGRGTKVSSSLVANGAWANGVYVQAALCGGEPFRQVSHDHTPNALVNHYRTRDDRRFYLALVREAADWERFCRAIERPELVEDPRFAELEIRRQHARELTQVLDEVFAGRDLAEWARIFDAHAITYGPIARSEEVPEDPQLLANGALPLLEGVGPEPMRTVDSPILLRGVRKRPPQRAPRIGEHTRSVLQELGYPAERIAELERRGIARSDAGA